MEVGAFLDYLRQAGHDEGQVEHVEHLPARQASYGRLDGPLHASLESALQSAGLLPLYTHQARAVNRCRAGSNVMVVTPAASGKTLCYNIPVLNAILEAPQTRALYLYPTKALAQDQMRALGQIVSRLSSRAGYATYDGDTPHQERADIRKRTQIVMTNPDMLHSGILPNHHLWARLFRNLKFVVLDEAHIYRGIFGSHVANIVRRLRRICSYYGSNPTFICCSATIANPEEHIENLIGLPFEIVSEDGAPHGEKDFVFWNPPLISQDGSTRRSANAEAAFLFAELVRNEIRTLAFARSRRLTELIYKYARERLAGTPLADRISPYRAGYLPEERREIEQALFHGTLMGAVATVALELGVDIGGLDATILTGYPGSVSSTWQQAGRSGRRAARSLSVLIGVNSPLDQYIMRNPSFFFGRSSEHALINPENPYVMKDHLLCAAWELPLGESDVQFFGEYLKPYCDDLERSGQLKSRGQAGRFVMPPLSYPAERVNIRSASSSNFRVLDLSQNNQPLETVDADTAIFLVHPGAIYLHRGEPYLITQLDMQSHVAYATPTSLPYYTQTKELTDLSVCQVLARRDAGPAMLYHGKVRVTTSVVGFTKRTTLPDEVVGEEALDLPPQVIETTGMWFDIPQEAIEVIEEQGLDFLGGLHAAEHACIGMLPLFALCDRNDIGGVSTPLHPDTGRPQIFIHDAHPGGTGIAEKGFELAEHLWRATLTRLKDCPCEEGCPGCIQSPKCGNNNHPLDKKAAAIILKALLREPF